MKLSFLAVMLGLVYGLPQVYGFAKPAAYSEALRKFPRSFNWGVFLMLAGTAWFLYNVSQESIADFASSKKFLMMFFAAVGIGACVFVRDFLAVRGLAIVLLLLARLMVDAGRPVLVTTSWAVVIQTWAYVLAFLGMWLTISPWRLRDWIAWCTDNEQRTRLTCGIGALFGAGVALLGFAKY